MGTTEKLAKYVIGTRFEDIPKPVVERAKELILDAVAPSVAGLDKMTTRVINQYCRQTKSVKGEASVIGGGYKTSAENAVLVNATSFHSTELESLALHGGQLPGLMVMPALAVAERLGLSGKDTLEGFIMGFELYARLCIYTPGLMVRGFIGSPACAAIGSAALSSKLMKLNLEQTCFAMGLAASQSDGLIKQTGTSAHFLEFGVFAANGVRSALWAEQGLTALADVIEAPGGFCYAFAGEGGYNLEGMTENMGTSWKILKPGVSIKKYPCCFRMHRALDATLAVITENNIAFEDVAEVKVELNKYDNNMLHYPEPATGHEARFSMPHCIASALVDRKLTEERFSDEKIAELKAARKKVNVVFHPEWPPDRDGARVPITLKLRNGKEYPREFKEPREPATSEVVARFKTLGKTRLSKAAVDTSADMIMGMEKVKSINELMDLLRGTSRK